MKKRRIKKVVIIALFISICLSSIITCYISSFLTAYNGVSVLGNIFIYVGFILFLYGQIMMLYNLWRK